MSPVGVNLLTVLRKGLIQLSNYYPKHDSYIEVADDGCVLQEWQRQPDSEDDNTGTVFENDQTNVKGEPVPFLDFMVDADQVIGNEMDYPVWNGQIDLVWEPDWDDGSSMSADEDYPFVDDKSEGDEDMYDSHVGLVNLTIRPNTLLKMMAVLGWTLRPMRYMKSKSRFVV